MASDQPAESTKKGKSLLWDLEQKFINTITPKLPQWMNGYNLTWCNVFWTVGVVLFGLLAKGNINWLWLVSIMIFMQWLTDSFDGAVGRYRKTGLVKWGYYMDHLFDYLFLCAILLAYSFVMPDGYDYELFLVLIVFGAFMVNSFLSFGATREFKIEYLKIGPTEVRIIFIIINSLIILFGKTYIAFALPPVLAFSVLGLWLVIFRTQRYIIKLDMKNKGADNLKDMLK
jgi:phosphatidylglycerophosphate synthase